MPYKSIKVRNKNCYKVYKNDKTKKVFAKCATKENAQRQMRLLRAIQNNKNFKPNARRNMGGKSRKNKTLKIKGGLPPPRVDDENLPQVVNEQLHSGDYVKLNIGDRVNFIDTNYHTNPDGSVTYFLSPYGAVIEEQLYRENMEIIGDGPIEGYIVGMGIRFPRQYYHMIVTKGNDMIGVGLHFHLDTHTYNNRTHPVITPSRSTSLPFP